MRPQLRTVRSPAGRWAVFPSSGQSAGRFIGPCGVTSDEGPDMPIKVVIEFQARPGQREELKNVLAGISATHGPTAPGFLGSAVYATLDDEDGLVEIAEWESAKAQGEAVRAAMAVGLYAPVMELVAAPFRATRIGDEEGRL